MYLYRQSCYATPLEAFTAMASDCAPIGANGQSLTCQPTESGLNITIFDGLNTINYSSTPFLNECAPDFQQVYELSGLLMLLLVAAFGIQQLKRVP